MRRLLWFAIGFSGACLAGTYLFWGRWILILLPAVLSLILILLLLKDRVRKISLLLCLGVLTGLGFLWGQDALRCSGPRALDGETYTVAAEATDYSYLSGGRSAVRAKIRMEEGEYAVMVYLPDDSPISPGDRITGKMRFRFTGFGGEGEPTFHAGRGIFLLLYAEDSVQLQKAQSVPTRYFPVTLRKNLKARLESLYPEDTAGFAQALILGDDENITYEDDKAMQLSGIRHVIAVSGLHVSILFGMIYTACGKRPFLTAFLGIPVLLVFAALAGFTPSVNRACLMQLLMILALLCNREYDPPTALSFAVLVILMHNPLAITSVAFQLSAGSMAGIQLFAERIKTYLMAPGRLGRFQKKKFLFGVSRWFSGCVSVTLGAMTVTAPLCALYFKTVSLVGILTSLLTLWVITYIFCGILLSCLLSLIWMPVGRGLAWLISWPIRYVMAAARFLAGFSLSAVYTGSLYILLWLGFCYVLLGIFLRSTKKRPWMLAGCMAASLACCVLLTRLEPKMDDCRVTVLDVGQGQSVLLQTRDEMFLVDCGSRQGMHRAEAASRELLSQGVTHLDGVILTHYDSDHVNGLPSILSRFSTDRLYMPDIWDKNGLRQQIEGAYPELCSIVTETAEIPLNEGTLTIFPSHSRLGDNESGLCVLFQPREYDILITGDRGIPGEQALMEQTDLPDLELLIAGHHGSKTSTGLSLLQKTRPQLAAISCGKHNPFGHPAWEVLERLELFGCRIFRTDLQGTIIFRG